MQLNAKTTALVLIDLQKGVLARPVVPVARRDRLRALDAARAALSHRRQPRRVGAGIFRRHFADAPALRSISRATLAPYRPGGMSSRSRRLRSM